MANMVDAALAKAMVFAARWLSAVVLTVFVFGRSAAVSARRLWSTSAGSLPPVGQQLLNSTVQLRRQPGEHVLEVGPGLVPVELGRLQQTHHDSSPFARQLTSDEEPITAAESNHRVILPMSGRRWRSSTAGMHSMVVVFDGNTANSERQVRWFMSRSRQA